MIGLYRWHCGVEYAQCVEVRRVSGQDKEGQLEPSFHATYKRLRQGNIRTVHLNKQKAMAADVLLMADLGVLAP